MSLRIPNIVAWTDCCKTELLQIQTVTFNEKDYIGLIPTCFSTFIVIVLVSRDASSRT